MWFGWVVGVLRRGSLFWHKSRDLVQIPEPSIQTTNLGVFVRLPCSARFKVKAKESNRHKGKPTALPRYKQHKQKGTRKQPQERKWKTTFLKVPPCNYPLFTHEKREATGQPIPPPSLPFDLSARSEPPSCRWLAGAAAPAGRS